MNKIVLGLLLLIVAATASWTQVRRSSLDFIGNRREDCPTQIEDGVLCQSTVDGSVTIGFNGEALSIGTGGEFGVATLDEAFDGGKAIDGANSFANRMQIGDGTDHIGIYVHATYGPVIAPVIGGAEATFNVLIQDGDPRLTILENAGANNTCVTQDDTGLTTYAAVESCGTIAGAVTFTGAVVHSSTVTNSGTTSHTGGSSGYGLGVTVTSNPYTMLTTDCGKTLWINTGAGEVDLIADPTGGISGGVCTVCFFQVAAITLLLDPNSTDIIEGNNESGTALTLAAGDRLQLANQAGNNVCLSGFSATQWKVWPGSGALTDAN